MKSSLLTLLIAVIAPSSVVQIGLMLNELHKRSIAEIDRVREYNLDRDRLQAELGIIAAKDKVAEEFRPLREKSEEIADSRDLLLSQTRSLREIVRS